MVREKITKIAQNKPIRVVTWALFTIMLYLIITTAMALFELNR